MDKLTSLLTTIWDTLTASSWYQAIQWPFWTLLVVLAIGGIHTAHFEKRKLLTLGFQGALKLALVYFFAAAGYIWIPSVMSRFSQLPFLSVSEEALTLVNPLGLLDRWNTALPRVVVRLYFLLFFINLFSVFDYQTPNVLGWFCFQVLFGALAVSIYALLSSAVLYFWPGNVDYLYCGLAVLIILVFMLILGFRLYYTFIVPGGSSALQPVHNFLTNQKFGQQFTVSALSFLIVVGYLVIASMTGHSRLELGSVNRIAFLLNGLLCTVTLYIFNRYYNGP